MENIYLEKALEEFDEDIKKAKQAASQKYVREMMEIHKAYKAEHQRKLSNSKKNGNDKARKVK